MVLSVQPLGILIFKDIDKLTYLSIQIPFSVALLRYCTFPTRYSTHPK